MSNTLRTSREPKPYLLPYSVTRGKFNLFSHVIGHTLCLSLLLPNLSWNNWYYIPFGMFMGMISGDLSGGLAHYAFDNYGLVDSSISKLFGFPFIVQYLAHHDYPSVIVSYNFWETNSDGLYITSMVLFLVYFLFRFSSIILPYLYFMAPYTPAFLMWFHSDEWTAKSMGLLAFAMTGLFYNAFTNQFHKWSHMPNPPPIIAFLQRKGLLLSFAEHQRHHVNPKIGYCLTTGWCNYFLEKIYFWEILDYTIVKVLGKDRVEESKKVEARLSYVKSVVEKNK